MKKVRCDLPPPSEQPRIAKANSERAASIDPNQAHCRSSTVEKRHFLREDGKFLVETDGPDGKLATFQVKYTFGDDPLQQYLYARRLARMSQSYPALAALIDALKRQTESGQR